MGFLMELGSVLPVFSSPSEKRRGRTPRINGEKSAKLRMRKLVK